MDRLLLQVIATEKEFHIKIDGENAEIIEAVSVIFEKMIEDNPLNVEKDNIFRLLNKFMEAKYEQES